MLILPALQQFVLGVDLFDLTYRIGTNHVFHHDQVARLRDREVRFGGDHQPEHCSSVLTSSLLLVPFSSTSPRFDVRPSGVTAHNTYVRYSVPFLVAACRTIRSLGCVTAK